MTLPDAATPFNQHASEYDRWYDTPPLFDIELEAIRAASRHCEWPRLEAGVGPGRFAQALGIEYGLDPATSPLQLASGRGIMTINGIGEQLPVRTQSIGTVFLLFTLCFLTDPSAVFREFFRVLKPGGSVVVGFIPARSRWGQNLAQKGKADHPFYRFARFQTVAETTGILTENCFEVRETWSTLFQPPTQHLDYEHPCRGASEEAGLCVLTARKKGGALENC